MAWGIRKRVRVGPANLNLSKHGIGTSLGARGIRMGVDRRGRRYSHRRGGTGFELAGLVLGATFLTSRDACKCSSARALPCRCRSPRNPRPARLPVCSVFRPRSAPRRSPAGLDIIPPLQRPWERIPCRCLRTNYAAFADRFLRGARRARRRERWRRVSPRPPVGPSGTCRAAVTASVASTRLRNAASYLTGLPGRGWSRSPRSPHREKR
jgi:Protein of unknown function (DUF4236)